ncbi:MAG: collagen-like triple helix repeat-containing protein [Bacilli bacterium]
MFTGKQFGVLGLVTGANLLLSLLVSTVGGSLGAQGPTGQTGPQGPQGSTGETGANGREVEFQVDDNVLQWRYVGDTTWQNLDLEISGGGTTINNGSTNGFFSNWIYTTNPVTTFQYRNRIIVEDSASYAADLIANEGYVGISNLSELLAIDDSQESMNGKYVLTSNLDLSTWSPDFGTQKLSVIGDSNIGTFGGVFDGAGYSISNLTIDGTDSGSTISYSGLFYQLNEGSIIQNLNLNNFNFVTSSNLNYVGALAATTTNSTNDPLIIDQVYLDGVNFVGDSDLQRVGGLIGQMNSNTSIIRTSATNVVAKSNSYFYAVGGLYGYVDSGYTTELYEINANFVIEPRDGSSQIEADRVGAIGGNHQSNSVILANQITSSFTGDVNDNSSAFIGNVAGYSKVILKDIEVNATITSSFPTTGDAIGGLFGFYGRDGMLFIDDVVVNGSIDGYENIGGFIGYAKEGSIIKISNSTSNANLKGMYDLGGLVGRLNYYRHRWLFDNVEVNSTITLKFYENSQWQGKARIGGLIGLIEERDDSDITTTNQVWVKDSTVSVNVEVETDEVLVIESRTYDLEYIGGLFGEVSYDNEVRVTNTDIELGITLDYGVAENITYYSMYLSEVGGIAGYTQESNILSLGVTSQVDIRFRGHDFTPLGTENYSLDFSTQSLGGAFGEVDSGQVTIVASEFGLNLDSILTDITSNYHDYYINIDSIGGVIGFLDDEALALVENTLSATTVNIEIDNISVAEGKTLHIWIQENGALIGDAEGVAIFTNMVRTIEATVTIPAFFGETIVGGNQSMLRDVGTANPFIFIG